METVTGSTCQYNENFLSSTKGVLLAGGIIGILASLLQYLGNPGNMGICVACFERDIAGALGLGGVFGYRFCSHS